MGSTPSFDERERVARLLIVALFEDFEATVKAIVADGWPAPMARAGLALHRHTWDVDALVEGLERELYPFGGLAALDGFAPLADRSARAHIVRPAKVVHLWPSLPGTGLTPVLYGWLLGCAQLVRPSSRTSYFAQHFWKLWQQVCGPSLMQLEYDAPNPSWKQADVIVMSGGDDTVEAISEFVGHPKHRQHPVLMGYGHRVSAAVIVDDGTEQTMQYCAGLAMDAVMWHQRGCFSARGVIFCGAAERALAFAKRLGESIELAEHDLGATTLSPAELAQRVQARGVAQFQGDTFGEGIGWVQWTDGPFVGLQAAPHVLSLHHIESLAELEGAIKMPSHQLQGCALGCSPSRAVRQSWARELARLGFTRICQPGQLQSPPAGWSHDGWPNITDWLRFCSLEH